VITLEQLRAICPRTGVPVLARFVDPLNTAFERWDVSTPQRRADFLAQYAHETDGFQKLDERLHYTDAERVRAMFGRHFKEISDDDVRGFMESPEMFASRIYAERMGNGPEATGDGYRYRGRGLCHLTGKGNYALCGEAIALDLVDNPDLLLAPGPACLAGGWYWKHCGANALADRGDFRALTRAINGGEFGLASREQYLARAGKALELA
jgi:putative chitinase